MAFVSLVAGTAQAVELLLAQPSPCAIGDEISFRVERALGQPLASAAELRCTIRIERDGEAFAARLELARPDGSGRPRQRAFQASSCETLTDTLALAVVLALGAAEAEAHPARVTAEPGATELGVTAEPLPSTRGAPRVAPVDDDAAAAASPRARVAPRWGLRAALAADAGTLPGVGFGALLGASFRHDGVELRAFGTYLPSRRATLESSGALPMGAELGLLAGSVLACAPALARGARLELGACAGGELGRLSGQGHGLSSPRSNGAPWWAARIDLAARWPLGVQGFALEALAGAVVPLSRDDFAIADEGRERVVFRPAPVAARASLGLGFELD